MELPANVASAAADFAARVRARFGPRVRQLALFGSYARGEQHEDSDVDIAVVIDDLTDDERREVWHAAGDICLSHKLELSATAMSTAHMQFLRGRELLIAEDIDREGIPL